MADWHQLLAGTAHNVEAHFDKLKYRLRRRLKSDRPLLIVPYAGYGTPEKLTLRGRVLAKKDIVAADDNDSLWRNLLNTYRRMESDEVPFARVAVTGFGQAEKVQADEEGYFKAQLTPTDFLTSEALWHKVDLTLLDPSPPDPVRATGEILVPSSQAQFGVISDIDDTVVESHATDWLRMARTVFLGNARTRLPFPGVAAFYRALQQGTAVVPHNPLFYISSSPWNLYDLLSEFFALQAIPKGPILLRDWGITSTELLPTRHKTYKLDTIQQVLQTYPDLPFILVGDSGQEDPEIYADVVRREGARILAVYIRNVSPDAARRESVQALAEEVESAGSTLLLADDTLVMAEHAAANGWITSAALASVKAEKQQDETASAAEGDDA